ncbi:uncharacterized protein [Clytia hemisphaerica]|uniref:Delta-like protein n=1 Tax=Clytia hemisphaerica TaxID=252671 RepID=A0A7M5VGK5_9CNID|eukprot:TCONS_00025272-protein
MLINSYPLFKTVFFKNRYLIKDPNRKKRKFDHLLRKQSRHPPRGTTLLDYLLTLILHRYYTIYLVFMTRLYLLVQILIFSVLQIHCYRYVASVHFKHISGLSSSIKLASKRKGGNPGKMLSNDDPQFSFRTELIDLEFDPTISLINAVGSLPKRADSLRVMFNQTYTIRPLVLKLTIRQIGSNTIVLKERFGDELRFNDTEWNAVRTSSLINNQQISFSYKLACPPNMYGPICGKQCKPSPKYSCGKNGERECLRYTCGNNGKKHCSKDWFGTECNRRCDCQDSVPRTGRCLSDGRCECYKGWTGYDCARDLKLCYTTSCQNGGTCSDINGQCNCPPTHVGQYCEKILLKPSSSIILVTSTKLPINETHIIPSDTSIQTNQAGMTSSTIMELIQPSTSVSIMYSTMILQSSSVIGIREQKTISFLETSSVYIEPSPSGVSSSTITMSSITPTLITESATNASKDSSDTGTIIAVISTTIFISLAFTMFLFWLIWRRKRLQRRKSQVSNIVTMTTDDDPDTLSRPSTFSSTRSVSPLINYLYEKDSLPSPRDPPDLEVFSVLDKPAVFTEEQQEERDEKKYTTLKEIDRICMEALKGPSSANNKKTEKPYNRANINVKNYSNEQLPCCDKTLSNISRDNSSYTCSSSGYESGSSTPLSSQSGSATSTRLPPSRLEKRIQGGRHSASSSSTPSRGRRRSSERNNNSSSHTLSSQSSSHNECFEEEDGELIHSLQTKHHVQFEGLPNFIMYREDTNV